MKCPKCRCEIKIKKNELKNCKCGAKLMAIKINKKLIIEDLKKEENK